MEATPSVQIKVGIFLIAGLLIAMVSIFMIGGESSWFSHQVRFHARFDEVQGLAEGSVVSLAGVSIGNIEKITFQNDINQLDVTMRVETRFAPRVRVGTLVEIRTQGALGDKFLFLIPADPKNPVAKDGETFEVAKANDIFSVVADHGKDTEKFFGILNEVYKMTRSINDQNRLEKLMTNLTLATGNLRDFSAEAKQLTSNLGADSGIKMRQTIEHMDSIAAKIDRGEGTLGALINDPSLHEQLKTMLGGSSRGQAIKGLIRNSIEKSQGAGR